jgi:DNA-directed RNA polymerase subunit K/omega
MSTLKYKKSNIEDVSKTTENINKQTYISKPIMTKYEFDKVIGLRTMQLSNGAIPFVKKENFKIARNMDLRSVAIEELKEGRLPYIIERTLSNNKKEYVRIKDLSLVAVQDRIRD